MIEAMIKNFNCSRYVNMKRLVFNKEEWRTRIARPIVVKMTQRL